MVNLPSHLPPSRLKDDYGICSRRMGKSSEKDRVTSPAFVVTAQGGFSFCGSNLLHRTRVSVSNHRQAFKNGHSIAQGKG